MSVHTLRFNTVEQAESFARALRRRAYDGWKIRRSENDVNITFHEGDRALLYREIKNTTLALAILPVLRF